MFPKVAKLQPVPSLASLSIESGTLNHGTTNQRHK